MKTNFLPALIMLCAGLVDCILAIKNRLSLREFTLELLIVLVVFYLLGILVRFVLDKAFGAMTEEEEEEEAQTDVPSETEVENIDVDDAGQEEEKQ